MSFDEPVTRVAIVESEIGWGQRVDEIKEFKNRTAAETFVRKFNERNNKDQVPDWYMFAEII